MPLILPSSAIGEWIKPDGEPSEKAAQAVTDVFIEEAG